MAGILKGPEVRFLFDVDSRKAGGKSAPCSGCLRIRDGRAIAGGLVRRAAAKLFGFPVSSAAGWYWYRLPLQSGSVDALRMDGDRPSRRSELQPVQTGVNRMQLFRVLRAAQR